MNKKRTGFSANNTKVQSDITGWRDVTNSEIAENLRTYCTLKVNEKLKLAQLTYYRNNFTVNGTNGTISSIGIKSYKPSQNVHYHYATSPLLQCALLSDSGNLLFSTTQTNTFDPVAVNMLYRYG